MQRYPLFSLPSSLFLLLCPFAGTLCSAQTGPQAQLKVEYLGAEHGYSLRHEDLILLCIVRNISGVTLPEKTMRLHCLPLSGLDYTDGDTLPLLPTLAPDHSVAVRWRLAPTNATDPLIASAFVEPAAPAQNMSAQRTSGEIAMTVIPRLDETPRFGAIPINTLRSPQAGKSRGEAWLAGTRIALRALRTAHGQPLLLLAGSNAGVWQTIAASLSVARIRSSEEGQTAWWQSFRWRQTRVGADKESASLILSGTAGRFWLAELQLTARRDTAAIQGVLRLTARRNLRCLAVELPRLITTPTERSADAGIARADGRPIMISLPSPLLSPEACVAAERTRSGISFGLAWPTRPALSHWNWQRLPIGDGDTTEVLGIQWTTPERGELMLAGGTISFGFRLFAYGPSSTIRDALRFIP